MKIPDLKIVVTENNFNQKSETTKSKIPKPLLELSNQEKKIWRQITLALHEEGLIHLTDVLLLHTVVTTFVRWAHAESAVQNLIDNHGGYIIKTPNGYALPHPMYYAARDFKKDLGRLLPEACLTMPSFIKAKAMLKQPFQTDMFDDELARFVGSKPHLVGG